MVEVELAGKVMLEGILDSGSQIVVLRQEIAKVLRLPIERDSRIIMEAMNQSKDETLGLVRDASLRIGPAEVPFLCTIRARTQDYRNGQQTLEFTDPETEKRIQISLQPRRSLTQFPQFRDTVLQREYIWRIGRKPHKIQCRLQDEGF
ncbi:hypothetical protein M404DRAFT_24589 [Pisolithus tinctorius Marx 270]|uniref:Uncharacterized protein n=1 Tax=Pisolithus tinctorius Marx 270 TaxID=870435 RepID=A0A0C3JB62_PISTI|nr:hypothetical protein M404DRAFT_24589 [Pisolithus tinctorius Marx 270]